MGTYMANSSLLENATVTWMYEYAEGLWQDMEPHFANQLTSAAEQGDDTVEMVSPLVIDGKVELCSYEFNLTDKVQTNHFTKTQRRIRCVTILK